MLFQTNLKILEVKDDSIMLISINHIFIENEE